MEMKSKNDLDAFAKKLKTYNRPLKELVNDERVSQAAQALPKIVKTVGLVGGSNVELYMAARALPKIVAVAPDVFDKVEEGLVTTYNTIVSQYADIVSALKEKYQSLSEDTAQSQMHAENKPALEQESSHNKANDCGFMTPQYGFWRSIQ
ncbi:hypothetical protein D6777_00445 [Candidatus Woesearchaeota archaeon]|nr:MAG: hypothetical protein D6777_00445 [Candidatus Woesearchaeota archaeon]